MSWGHPAPAAKCSCGTAFCHSFISAPFLLLPCHPLCPASAHVHWGPAWRKTPHAQVVVMIVLGSSWRPTCYVWLSPRAFLLRSPGSFAASPLSWAGGAWGGAGACAKAEEAPAFLKCAWRCPCSLLLPQEELERTPTRPRRSPGSFAESPGGAWGGRWRSRARGGMVADSSAASPCLLPACVPSCAH